MNILRTSIATFLLVSASFCFGPTAAAQTAPTDVHHVMYKSSKGKDKCCNKNSKEKADRCAGKLRAKGKATGVEVMAGSCKSMKR